MTTILDTIVGQEAARAALDRAKGTRLRGRRKKPPLLIGDVLVCTRSWAATGPGIPEKFLSPLVELSTGLRHAIRQKDELICTDFIVGVFDPLDPQPIPILTTSDGRRFSVPAARLKSEFRVVHVTGTSAKNVPESEKELTSKEMTVASLLSAEITRDEELIVELETELAVVKKRKERKEKELLKKLSV